MDLEDLIELLVLFAGVFFTCLAAGLACLTCFWLGIHVFGLPWMGR